MRTGSNCKPPRCERGVPRRATHRSTPDVRRDRYVRRCRSVRGAGQWKLFPRTKTRTKQDSSTGPLPTGGPNGLVYLRKIGALGAIRTPDPQIRSYRGRKARQFRWDARLGFLVGGQGSPLNMLWEVPAWPGPEMFWVRGCSLSSAVAPESSTSSEASTSCSRRRSRKPASDRPGATGSAQRVVSRICEELPPVCPP
jgi:hypothetical protein